MQNCSFHLPQGKIETLTYWQKQPQVRKRSLAHFSPHMLLTCNDRFTPNRLTVKDMLHLAVKTSSRVDTETPAAQLGPVLFHQSSLAQQFSGK